VTTTITRPDFIYLQRRAFFTKLWWFPPVMGAAMYVAESQSAAGALYGVAAAAVFLYFFPLWQWRMARKRDPSFGAPTAYTFSSTGISFQCATADVRLDWAGWKSFRETDRYLLLYVLSSCFYFLPKRDLADSDLRAIRDILRTSPPEGKRLSNPT
jgi:hypothetical protein